jgi:hypothetical protein
MITHSRSLLAILLAAGLMAVAASSASANKLSINEPRFRITWASLEFVEEAFGVDDDCPVTLEGSFHSATISKVPRSLIGYITRAGVTNNNCTGGHLTILQESLPWHVTYERFTGGLPNISSFFILLRGVAWKEETSGPFGNITCLIRLTNLLLSIPGTIEGGGAFKPTGVMPGTESFSCGGLFNEHLAGSGRVTRLGSTEPILIRLI